MNRRSSSGGGESSLGYLFGSDKQQNNESKGSSPLALASTTTPPYGTDDMKAPPLATKTSPNKFIYHGDGDNSKDFLVTGRPSTKVKSVPGGDSSLGYLFGDK